MSGRLKTMLAVIVIALAVFGVLLAVETNEIKKYERKEMAVAIKDVPAGTKITKSNVGKYFEIRECDHSLETQYNLKKLDSLIGKYTQTTVYANTILQDFDFADYNLVNSNISHPVKVSFACSSLADAMSGTLRMGDVVKLYVAQSYENRTIEVLEYPVIIEAAFDSAGLQIKAGDTASVATNFNISIDKEDEADFYACLNAGDVKIVKQGENDL